MSKKYYENQNTDNNSYFVNKSISLKSHKKNVKKLLDLSAVLHSKDKDLMDARGCLTVAKNNSANKRMRFTAQNSIKMREKKIKQKIIQLRNLQHSYSVFITIIWKNRACNSSLNTFKFIFISVVDKTKSVYYTGPASHIIEWMLCYVVQGKYF